MKHQNLSLSSILIRLTVALGLRTWGQSFEEQSIWGGMLKKAEKKQEELKYNVNRESSYEVIVLSNGK